ncbi:DUF2800 domain-containing protein [Sporomusa sphaeroides DSM 2875]|uniref:DUF2800 domain-containing protein n=1 Tax=Sporomusa sphaeroides TaxID=47679 RepID=UPI00202F7A8B|nr:DUF2800 domain-containing protein [Sporomusa sphaeroides]MCM0760283.1 DUF2800 domain-containing protein [Sporomusa sphaeroides DSM 2875]
MSAHALLSASGAHKWLSCPPSARLEETLPESTSQYAEEGRLAHEIAELKLRKHFTEPMGPKKFNNQLKKFQENPLYQDEMLRHTDTYKDYISGIVHSFASPPYVAIEKKLNYAVYAPDGFGTGDAIIIGGNTLHVIDLKYGKGVPVSAFDNPQMKLYALGAYLEYAFLFAISTVKMAIVQPRLDSISEFEMPITDLLAWGESIKPIAAMAFKGEGDFVPGEHCRFCRAKAQCRARSDFNLGLEEFHKMKPPLISNEEVGEILKRAQDLTAWAKHLEEYALAEILKGNDISGWKAVHGRSTRSFTDTDEAFKVLIANGTPETMLYERKPLTLTGVEDLLGKAKFKELLTSFVNTPPGKPALAPESDKREAIKRTSAADDFSEPISVTM